MTQVDTSPEAVEQKACLLETYADAGSFDDRVAATLRALLRERDVAWQAGAEAMREAARETAKGRMLHLAGTSDRDLLALGAACVVDALDGLPIPERKP